MNDLINPHDKFFKEVFSDVENARDIIAASLPGELLSRVDLASLTLQNNSFINEDLRECFSDIIYTCRYRSTYSIMLPLLLEHKSHYVQYPHFQLLKYLVNAWETCVKQRLKLQPIIPIIIYHGVETWNAKKMWEYFEGIDEHLLRYIPGFEYLLTDLAMMSDEDIKNRVMERCFTRSALLIMKNIFDHDMMSRKLAEYLRIC